MTDSITDVPGIKVGHAQNIEALTGCTVILCPSGTTGGVDQRGGAPGTRETDALRPMHLVNTVHAIVLAGGSAFGLDASSGVMKYLEEKKIGFNSGPVKVPIVASAILFDLGIGSSTIRPDLQMGYQACLNAKNPNNEQGNIGAGTGATVGKILGASQSMKTGIGTASEDLGGGLFVGALMAVNAFGDVLDPLTREIIAGTRTLKKGPIKIGRSEIFADTQYVMKTFAGKTVLDIAAKANTVIGVVATNAKLTKEETNKVAQMAQNGIALSIRPAHTMFDGDTIFALATNKKHADVNLIGTYAAEVVARAIVNAVMNAASAAGIPAASEIANAE
jgi:L-aminopeptidase/D-esterase-like protein